MTNSAVMSEDEGYGSSGTNFINKDSDSVVSGLAKKKRRKRPINIEEVFATISPMKAHDANPRGPPRIILTPRSAESCLRQGVDPVNLLIRDLDSFWEPGIDTAVQHMRHESYSQIRHQHMKIARQERERLIDSEGGVSGMSPAESLSPDPYGDDSSKKMSGVKAKLLAEAESKKSSLVKQEMARLQKMQSRQQKEIEQMLAYEMKMSNIQTEAQRRLAKEQRMADARERERLKRIKLVAEEMRQKELKKKAGEEIEERRRQQVAAKMFAKEKEIEAQRQEKLRQQRIEAREREIERDRKAEEHKRQTKAIFDKQQSEIAKKLQEMEQNEQIREEVMRAKHELYAKEMEEKRAAVELRMAENQKQNRMIMKKKKDDFYERQRVVEDRRIRLEEKKSIEAEEERKMQELNERRRQIALQEAKNDVENRKQELIARHHLVDATLDRVQEERSRQLQLKKERSILIKQQRIANVERQKRIDEYRRLQTLKTLHDVAARTDGLLKSKEDLIEERKRSSIRAKLRRDKVIKALAEIKLSKKWDTAAKKLRSAVHDDGSSKSPKRKKKSQTARSQERLLEAEEGMLPRVHSAEAAPRGLQNEDEEPQAYQSPYDAPGAKLNKKDKARKKGPYDNMNQPAFITEEDKELVTF